jgi:hypothetical protein
MATLLKKDPAEALKTVIQKWKEKTAPPYKLRVSRETFVYVVVRDTLIELGVRFRHAEHLAKVHAGDEQSRLNACLEHVR